MGWLGSPKIPEAPRHRHRRRSFVYAGIKGYVPLCSKAFARREILCSGANRRILGRLIPAGSRQTSLPFFHPGVRVRSLSSPNPAQISIISASVLALTLLSSLKKDRSYLGDSPGTPFWSLTPIWHGREVTLSINETVPSIRAQLMCAVRISRKQDNRNLCS